MDQLLFRRGFLGLLLSVALGFNSLYARADDTPAAERDAKRPTKIAIMQFKAPGFEAGVVENLYGLFVSEIASVPGYQVVSHDEIEAMLGFEAQKNMLGCDDSSCLAEIAGALGVDKVVSGKVGKVGQTFVINITLIDQKNARVEKRVVRTVKGQDDVLIMTIQNAAHELIGDKKGANNNAQASTTNPNSNSDGQAQASANTEQKAKKSSNSILPLILAGVGGVAVVASLGVLGYSGFLYTAYQDSTNREQAHSLAEETIASWITSGALGGIGLIAGGTGAVLMTLSE